MNTEITIDQIKLANSQDINTRIAMNSKRGWLDTNDVSDTYHTFGELYEHRIALWISLCRLKADSDFTYGSKKKEVWKSKLHSDGSSIDGWFVLGMYHEPGEQITYHLPISEWETCWFAEELERAPIFDNHTSADVLERIKQV